MRKKLLFMLAMVLPLFAAISCDGEGDPRLEAEYTGATVAASGGTATFAVTSNVDWEVTNSDTWITLITPGTGQGDGSVTVTFAANTTTQERSSVFTVSSETLTVTVTIAQAAAGESLTIEYTPASIPAAGGTATFGVVSNVEWTAASTDAWITAINPAQGTGNADVTVTVAANDTTEARTATVTVSSGSLPPQSVEITQFGVATTPPAAAGAITESDVTPTSVVLNIAEISGAETYKWYKDDAEVQNTASRTYTATEDGTYKVAGVNSVGEGTASPDHVVTLGGTGGVVSFNDYLGDYTFSADFRYITEDEDTTTATTYNDTMYDAATIGGEAGEMAFTNAINEYVLYETYTFMDFSYESNGRISYIDYVYDYLETDEYLMAFVPCVLTNDGYVGFVWEMELELDPGTGTITFPTTLTHDEFGTLQAYYVVWVWNASTNASEGRWSDNFMSNVVATKAGASPAPGTYSSSVAGGNIVKIPVKITPPAGFEPNTVVRADQIAVKK